MRTSESYEGEPVEGPFGNVPPPARAPLQGAESSRAARLEAVAVTQQQQLLAVRARLSKTERRVLALSQRDDGKAVLLAEAEARSATQACRLRDEEVAQLRSSLAQLEYAAAASKVGAFVVERAREVSMLRERLARAQSANQASSRRALERELIATKKQREEAEVAALAGAGGEGARGGRAKAAEFVVSRLRDASAELSIEVSSLREALAAKETELKAEVARRTSVEREALAAPRSGEPECATIERLQDELRELREGADPERREKEGAVVQTLFAELHAERKHVADLEASSGTQHLGNELGVNAVLVRYRRRSPLGAKILKLRSSPCPPTLLHGKELELRQMEHQVALLGEAALAETPEQENGAQQARMGQDRTPLAAAPLLKSAPPREPARETAVVVEAPEPMPTPSQAETEAKRVNEVTGEAEEAREAMEAEVPQRALAVDEPNGEGGDAATMKPAGSPASVIEVAGEAESIGGDEGELGRPGSAGEEIAKLTASAPTEVQKADAPEAVDVSDVVPGAGSEPVVGETEVAAVGEEVAPGSANVGGEATPQGEAVTEETSLDGTDAEAESGAESGAVRVEAEHDDAQTESVIDPPTDAGETEAGELGEPEGEGPEAEIAAPIEAAPEVGEGSKAEPERR
ncbi:hypothetical protein EMIHUDRAFT_203365 [Emiliania huxleyi CCMP1516]|uniref:Uncharacterized protein n=2 Tax=Emiliania huxleyi TaxID=2903 RepID=A0A0D3K618_EMIH1|nr:hypothetical protein EMIHUDRAFT_203365 [Emiliania huxleyi CCMP1516]EOD31203.1 hypothetical protein EMIHUDRAFT_203365 [Emiliania huxleyi CCMP1516]|eukprot:XP_005783632.1 hypothetical protein EMIHUDRAFT_203365 [Emiliania huxleyi CCMP1516]